MTQPQRSLFSWAGLLASIATAMVAGSAFIPSAVAEVTRDNPHLPDAPLLVGIVLAVFLAALTAGFAAIFLRLTAEDLPPLSQTKTTVLIILQTLLAWITVTDFFYVLSAELGFLFPGIRGWKAAASLLFALLTSALYSFFTGTFESSPELSWLPYPMQASITLIQVTAWCFFAFAVGRIAAKERSNRQQLEASLHEVTAMHHLLEGSAKVSERLRIARELHNALGHHLTSLNLNLQLASRLAEGKAQESVRDAHMVSKLLLSDVRDIVTNMRDAGAEGLNEALGQLASPLQQPNIHLNAADPPPSLTPVHAHILFRVVQEGITNAIRHANPSNVWIDLHYSGNQAFVTVRDDGKGSTNLKPGNGLTGMRERLETFGGTLRAQNTTPTGFALSAVLPLEGVSHDTHHAG